MTNIALGFASCYICHSTLILAVLQAIDNDKLSMTHYSCVAVHVHAYNTSKWMFFSKYSKNARLQFTFNTSGSLGMFADETALANLKFTLGFQQI